MKKIVSYLLAGTLVISCFALPASAAIIDGDGPVFESNDAYSGLIDGQGPNLEEDDDFAETIAQPVIDQIAALGEITSLDQEAAVEAARTAYDALTDAQKACVTNYADLEAAEAKIADLAAAKDVIDEIAALGTITLDKEDAVNAARDAYDALTDAQKALVTNEATLTAAEQKIEDLRVKRGDVDGDGKVTVSDVVELRKLIVAGTWTDQEFAAGNLDDSDQTLTVSDVVELRKLIVAGVQ